MATSTEQICYEKNFLTDVIARIDLVSPLPNLTSLPKTVGNTALQHFPLQEVKEGFKKSIQISPKDMDRVNSESFKVWNFFSANREKQLTITPDFFFISHKKYDNYFRFKEEFCSINRSLLGAFPDAQPARLGLRYVNQFRFPVQDVLNWSDYIEPILISQFDFRVEGSEPSRIFSNYEVKFEDFNLTLRYGLHNPDHPAPIRQNLFVLDIDAYQQGLIEPASIEENLDRYHEEIQKLFERCITKNARAYLNATSTTMGKPRPVRTGNPRRGASRKKGTQ